MKKLIIFTFLLVCANAQSQDVHFSQYWNNSIQYNPANTGLIPANYRASTFYKNQWSSVNSPYKTIGLNFDTRLEPKGNTDIGVGLNVYKDIAGDNKLGTTHAQLALSSIMNLGRLIKVSVGVNGGIVQKGFDPSNATWGNQYVNGNYNSSAPTGETFINTSEIQGDLSVGACYYFSASESYSTANNNFSARAGISLNHILQPKYQWFESGPDQLYRNVVAHAEFIVGIPNTNFSLLPAVITQFQGPNKEIMFGTRYRITLKDASKVTGFIKGAYLHLGTFVRKGDAFIPSVLLEFDQYSIGASYDINTSPLRAASGGNGGFEISLMFRTPNPHLWKGYGGKASFQSF